MTSEKVVAYSYVRYSFKRQEEGDSVRRQTDRAAAVARREGWHLDDSLRADRGVSAFRGKNALVGHLASFLADIEAGKVRPGSVLIVESVDRLSRQGAKEGWDLCRKILDAGVRIMTLSPERLYDKDATKYLMRGMLELLIILERAAEESQTKSDRIMEGWKARRGQCRTTGGKWHRSWPGWFRREGDAFVLDQEAVKTLRRVFDLALDGHGAGVIAQKLEAEGRPPLGKKHRWVRGTVSLYLRDRRVLGEFQPRTGTSRVADGPPIPDYFPRIISDQVFYAVSDALAKRDKAHRGRPAAKGEVNVFRGLARDARDGSTLMLTSRPTGGKAGGKYHVLANSAGQDQRARRITTFPYAPFEEMVLSALSEIDYAQIAGRQSEADYLAGLEGELAEVRGRIEALETELLAGDIGAATRVLRVLEAREGHLKAEIEKHKGKLARPLQGGWDAFHALLAAQRSASDRSEVKVRIRTALSRIVDEVRVLIVPRKLERWAAVQVYFTDGRRRLYLMFFRQAHNAFGTLKQASQGVHSWPESVDEATIDLRDKSHVDSVERALLEMRTAAL